MNKLRDKIIYYKYNNKIYHIIKELFFYKKNKKNINIEDEG